MMGQSEILPWRIAVSYYYLITMNDSTTIIGVVIEQNSVVRETGAVDCQDYKYIGQRGRNKQEEPK
jgi:hypothetical protein